MTRLLPNPLDPPGHFSIICAVAEARKVSSHAKMGEFRHLEVYQEKQDHANSRILDEARNFADTPGPRKRESDWLMLAAI